MSSCSGPRLPAPPVIRVSLPPGMGASTPEWYLRLSGRKGASVSFLSRCFPRVFSSTRALRQSGLFWGDAFRHLPWMVSRQPEQARTRRTRSPLQPGSGRPATARSASTIPTLGPSTSRADPGGARQDPRGERSPGLQPHGTGSGIFYP